MATANIKKDASGFTVVEIIVTILVGTVMLLGLNTIFTTNLFLNQRTRDTILANSFAEAKFEALRSKGYLGLSDGASDITAELPSELNSPRSATLTISSYTGAIKQADLSITYNEQSTQRTFTYRSLVGELGVGQY